MSCCLSVNKKRSCCFCVVVLSDNYPKNCGFKYQRIIAIEKADGVVESLSAACVSTVMFQIYAAQIYAGFGKKSKNLSSKNFPNLCRFFAEFIFGKKLQWLFKKACDFELFFRGFGRFFRGNLNRSLFLNVHLRSSFLIINLKRTKVLDKWFLLFFFQNKIGHIVLLSMFLAKNSETVDRLAPFLIISQ